MKIVLGSTSPAKLSAVRLAAEKYWGDTLDLTGVNVPSGVRDQPMDTTETVKGAFNRARAALAATPGATLGIGLEGGIDVIAGHLLLIGYVAVVDIHGQESLSHSCSTPLPAHWLEKLQAGTEVRSIIQNAGLGYDAILGTEGTLTHGKLGRNEVFSQAVMTALAPWVSAAAYTTP